MTGLPRRWGRVALTRWRSSLQTRVVGTTLVASGVVVALLATLLLDQVARGLVNAKIRSALSEARSAALQSQRELDQAGSTGRIPLEQQLTDITQQLTDRGATGDLYDVVLVGPQGGAAVASPGRAPADVPRDLLDQLDEGVTAYEFARVGGEQELVVGSVLSTPALGTYRLVQLFPLTAERQTLGLVRRTAAAAGLLLVGLLALVALLVTRQVVAPVRLAARTAQRLAAGLLDQRMTVRGEDELAALARSFNQMAAALQHQISRLEDLSRLQQRFVSDVSHELRTPLTTVRMAADVLHDERDAFPPAAARSAELLQAELDRFEALLVDLLEISRYDAGAAALDAAPTDLVVLTHRVLAQTAALAAARGTPVELDEQGPVIAEVDAVRIERALRNLVVNAVEHGEGRPVQVRVRGSGQAAAIVVRDHGVGLQPGQEALVFTRFWRADPSRARTSGGTGLGLAIAREDVRLHGGELEAWGAPARGASFRMTLPARVGAPLPPSPLPLVPTEAVA